MSAQSDKAIAEILPGKVRRFSFSATIRERLEKQAIPEPNSGCWLWTGSLNPKGYGLINTSARQCAGVHQVSYRLFCGEVPEGHEIDNTCHTRCCCNPGHLEAVTHAENVRRRPIHPMRERTHCRQGHPFEGSNLFVKKDGRRVCLECRRASGRKYWAAKKAKRRNTETRNATAA